MTQKTIQKESMDNDGNSPDNSSEKWSEIKKTRKKSSTKIKLNNKYSVLNENQSEKVNDKQLTNSKLDKTLFIPSIYLHDANYYQEILKDIKKYVKNEFSTKFIENTIKIMLTDQNDFEIITKFYRKMNFSFHTCYCPTDQKLAVAIKGIPHSLTVKELTKVIEKKFPLIRIQRVINRSNKPTSTCFVELVNNSDGREILNLEYIYYTKVTVEIWNMDKSMQCNNCQRYTMKRKLNIFSKSKIKQPKSCETNEVKSEIDNTKCNFCENYHKDFMLCPYYEKLFLKMDHKTIDFHSNKNEKIPEQKKHQDKELEDKVTEILKQYNTDSIVNQQFTSLDEHKTAKKEIYKKKLAEEEQLKMIFNEPQIANQTNDNQKLEYPTMVWLMFFVFGIYYLLLRDLIKVFQN